MKKEIKERLKDNATIGELVVVAIIILVGNAFMAFIVAVILSIFN